MVFLKDGRHTEQFSAVLVPWFGKQMIEVCPMAFYVQKRIPEVQSFILKFVNNHSNVAESIALYKRKETRARLNVVILVIPYEDGKLRLDQGFTAVSKEFSTTGMSFILPEPRGLDQVVIGLKFLGEMKFLLSRAIHLTPMGGGFYQLGLEFIEILQPADFPELSGLTI